VNELRDRATFLNFVFTRVVNHWVIVVGRQSALGAADRTSPDRLEPTLKVRDEMALGKKTAPVQYLRVIRPSFPEGTRTLEVGFINCASLMFPVGLSQGVFEGRRCGVPT